MQCSSHIQASCHLDFTSGHLRCIEAPARGAHIGGMAGSHAVLTRRSLVGATLAVASIVLAATAQGAVVDPDVRLVIRTYDATGAVNDLTTTLATAATILEQAGVGVTWVSCDAVFARRDENPCLAPLRANELAVRFIRLSPHLAEQNLATLGDSLIDTGLGTGSLASIYVNRV